MEFSSALNHLYIKRKTDQDLFDPFLLYCRLSDLCGASYEDKRKVALFNQVNKKLNLVEAVLSQDESVLERYGEVADLISESSFLNLVRTLKKVLSPDYAKKQPQKREQVKKQTKKTTNPAPKKNSQKAVVIRAEQPPKTNSKKAAEKPFAPPTYYGTLIDEEIVLRVIFYIGIAIVGLLCVLAVCTNFSWTTWQWLIGIVGGLALFCILGYVTWFIDDELMIDYYCVGLVIMGAMFLINLVLLIIFGGAYKIICGCLTATSIIATGVMMLFTYGDEEDFFWMQGMALVLLAGLFIASVVFVR